jgi:hypothetical protein
MAEDIGRNDPCHCGSGKKYKKCHLEKDEQSGRKEREKSQIEAAKVLEKEKEAAESSGKEVSPAHQPKRPVESQNPGWFKKVAGRMGFSGSTQRRAPTSNKGG